MCMDKSTIGKGGAKLLALGNAVVVRGLIEDEPLALEQDSPGFLHPVLPVPHPLAVAPAIGAEEGHLPSGQPALQIGTADRRRQPSLPLQRGQALMDGATQLPVAGDKGQHLQTRRLEGSFALQEDFVIQAGYPLDMRYAGPREALLHATFRQNYGINNLLVGRDHAGVGDFYGMFEAQEIFRKIPVPAEEGKRLLCQPLNIDWTFYCKKCDGMASMRTCPHSKEDRVILSGTKLRKMLSEGAEVPDHFGREEVLAILREYYSGLTEKVEIKMQRAASGSTM